MAVTVSAFDHPYLSGLLGDEKLAVFFTARAEIEAMVAFETALAVAESGAALIPVEAGRAIEQGLATFAPDMDALRVATARDGVVVPALVTQMRAAIGEPHGLHVHFGATSQDVIDTGLALRLARVFPVLERRLEHLLSALDVLEQRDGAVPTMAHTRMQAAIAVPAARKIASWRAPLARHRERLDALRADVLVLHLGGAAGTREKLGPAADDIARRMAGELGLRNAGAARHSERDGIVAFANWLSLVTGTLGKMGQDIALGAQTEVGEIAIADGGRSSAMPHKVNPVGAEMLVALARFNATLVAGMHHSLVHENERSGAAWTLEWMLLPQMTIAAGAALRTALALVATISFQDEVAKAQ